MDSIDIEPLQQTRAAFDSVAADYDGERGNNALIQDMRSEMWRWLDRVFPQPGELLDLGCGTGLDAVRMAQCGHRLTASDFSPRMVQRCAERAAEAQLSARVQTLTLGAHELERLPGHERFDGAYSNLGPLNCIPDPALLAHQCARLLKPGGRLVFSVIGRYCPWELLHYLRRRAWARATVRFARERVAVGMNRHTVWTRYYTPREFYRAFAPHFMLTHQRGLCVFAPPPYLTAVKQHYPRTYDRLWALDRRCAAWPVLRVLGDHFLLVMTRR
jgi:SAM-dependent methyltransferase